ncbi:MAG: 3-keto-disaccharide hydrolase [Bacteroidota bacterium]
MTDRFRLTTALLLFALLFTISGGGQAESRSGSKSKSESESESEFKSKSELEFESRSEIKSESRSASESAGNEGFVSLFNGEDLTGWIVPEGDGGHWRVVDGVIDYDALSEAPDDKNLWSEEEYGDFVLRLDWRIKETPFVNHNARIIRPDGTYQRDASGEIIRISVPDSDSGVYLRGSSKSQINIWSWPVGSGEVWGYRTDPDMPPEVAAGVTPSVFADNHIGEWNTFEITMVGERLTVELNGQLVIEDVPLPGVDARGPIALQHHGRQEDGEWTSSPSLVQFRNISIRKL